MKRRLLLILVLFFPAVFMFGQGGWRFQEMEVHIYIDSSQDFSDLLKLRLGPEPVSSDGSVQRVYATPAELEKIRIAGLRFSIAIENLNSHYDNFWDNPLVPPGYYTYEQIISIADSLATNFPAICQKILLGTSVSGRQLAVLKISDNVNTDEPEPEILFDGGIHGDEVGASENVIRYARDLCTGYGPNPTYTELINTREIFLFLMVNPDGRVAMSRYNSNMVDCNRDCGYMWNSEGNSTGAFSQIETKALRNLLYENQFVLYTNYHSGTEIISYPWSYRSNSTPDFAHIQQLASVYSSTSGYSNLQYGQGFNVMYAINGSTKDTQYGILGNVGWSVEISTNKQPPASQISMYYNYNVPAMTEMIKRCGWGMEGTITDSVTGAPLKASIWISNYYPVYSDPIVGDYHKYLKPGTYSIKVMVNGYKTKSFTNLVVPSTGSLTANIQLVAENNRYAYRVISCQIPGNNFGDEGYTPGSLGMPDNIAYSLGKNGWIVLDMGDTIFDGPGNDFKVFQAGTTPEGYTVSGSNSMDGPFSMIGTGNGTTSFDFASTLISKARYLKIQDDGDGSSSGANIGFDLDAVEMLTPPLLVAFSASNGTPCAGTGVNFTDESSGNPSSWTWTFPGGNPGTSTQQNPANILYDTPGLFDVTLTISNGISSSSLTKTGFINVKGVPEKPETPSGEIIACNNDSSLYTTVWNPESVSYTWDINPAAAGVINGTWVTGTVYWSSDFSGDAFIKVKTATACGESTWSDSLAVSVLPAPEVFLGNDTIVSLSTSLLLDAGNPGSTYQWSTGETTQTIQADTSDYGQGIHPYSVVVTTSFSCTATDEILINFDPSIGIDNMTGSHSVGIYPNPNLGDFRIDATGFRTAELKIHSLLGSEIISDVITHDHFSKNYNLPSIARGIYFLTVQEGDLIIKRKIIIR
jgi:PKD repeat protein